MTRVFHSHRVSRVSARSQRIAGGGNHGRDLDAIQVGRVAGRTSEFGNHEQKAIGLRDHGGHLIIDRRQFKRSNYVLSRSINE